MLKINQNDLPKKEREQRRQIQQLIEGEFFAYQSSTPDGKLYVAATSGEGAIQKFAPICHHCGHSYKPEEFGPVFLETLHCSVGHRGWTKLAPGL